MTLAMAHRAELPTIAKRLGASGEWSFSCTKLLVIGMLSLTVAQPARANTVLAMAFERCITPMYQERTVNSQGLVPIPEREFYRSLIIPGSLAWVINSQDSLQTRRGGDDAWIECKFEYRDFSRDKTALQTTLALHASITSAWEQLSLSFSGEEDAFEFYAPCVEPDQVYMVGFRSVETNNRGEYFTAVLVLLSSSQGFYFTASYWREKEPNCAEMWEQGS